MKITAGLGSVDDYLPYVEAGADEFFCGYVPYEWMKNGGLTYPLNRREVLYYNVQIGSESEMEILAALVRRKRKNSHSSVKWIILCTSSISDYRSTY